MDALDAWESFAGAGASGKGGRLFPAPYPLQATAARPIMLDTAAAAIEYPPLGHRLRGKKGAPTAAVAGGVAGQAGTGTFARLFGWGGGS